MSYIPPFFLLVLIFAVMFPGFGGEYLLLDDDDYVTANPFVRGGLTWDGIYWAWTSTHSGHWHPLTWLSLMLDIELFGLNSDASRVINIILHSISVMLLFFPVRALLGSPATAFLGCGLFAIHPLRLESVLWVSERKDVLAFFFFSLIFTLYEHSVRSGSVLSRRLASLCAFVGVLAKPSLVVMPLLLPLIDYIYLKERVTVGFMRASILKMWPYWLVSGAISVGAMIGQSAAGGLKSSYVLPLGERCNNVAIGYAAYLWKIFWPFDLSVFYPLQSLPRTLGMACGLLVIAITLFCFVVVWSGRDRPHRLLIAAWFWFLCALLPVIGIVQIGWQQYADRWTYIPHFLPIIALTSLIATYVVHCKRCAYTCGVLLLLLVGVETHRQSSLWLSSKPLFHQALHNTQKNFFIMTNLGVVYEKDGDVLQAKELYREALRHNPEYPLALNNLGTLLANEDRYSDSLVYFKRAIHSSPNFVPARFHLALALFRLEENMAAAIEWSKLLQIAPNHKEASEMLSLALKRLLDHGCKPFEILLRGQPEALTLQNVSDPATFSQLSAVGCITPQ